MVATRLGFATLCRVATVDKEIAHGEVLQLGYIFFFDPATEQTFDRVLSYNKSVSVRLEITYFRHRHLQSA